MSKKTVEVIIESENHYVIGVKKNQLKLYQHIEGLTKQKPVGWFSEIELNKGRLERREVKVFNLSEDISAVWSGAKQAVWVERNVKKKGKPSRENAYFISSFEGFAQLYCYGIRSHWSIENSLHWVKDVTLKEDASKIRSGNAPSNLSTLRNCALNIFRKNKMEGIAKSIRLVSNDIERLCQLII